MNRRLSIRALRANFLRVPLPRSGSLSSATVASQTWNTSPDGIERVDQTPDRTSGPTRITITIEGILYGLIAVLAVLTRFWDLTYRAQHHDESLHSYFSWLLYAGEGYVHDPMMHGPALFHSNALSYFLFGDNEYATRLIPALLGVGVVLLPALLRGHNLLGRWGALACSTLLLVSPTIMFYTRFNRHDPYVLFSTLLIIFSMLRYMEKRETKWIITVWVTTGFLFTTLEVSFIIAFTLVTFVGTIMAWQIDRRLLAIGAVALLALAAIWFGIPGLGVDPLPGIPWEDPSNENIRAFAIDLARHPIILAMLAVIVLSIVITIRLLNQIRDGRNWIDGVLGSTGENTTTRVMHDGLRDRKGMWFGILGGIAIFATLYTTLFTNMAGLASGTVGALGYWLGQQDVQRGDQPWFYYLLILPQYELVAVLLTPLAALFTLKRVIPSIRAGKPVGRRNYIWGLFLWWIVVHLAVFSWAGEKMPWLSVHMALPMIMLSGAFIGDSVERLEARIRDRQPGRAAALAAGGSVVAIGAVWFLLWSWASAGPWIESGETLTRTMRSTVADNWWILYLPVLALIAALAMATRRLGWRLGLSASGLGLVLVLLALQVHIGHRMSFNEGDVPRDMLIYVQSSPDVKQTVEDIGVLSRELTGGLDLAVWYDSGTSWPMQWYLRDYSNRRFYGTELTSPPQAAVVLISSEHLTDENRTMLTGYTGQEYAMRWWFPEEETYRRFAIAPELNKEWRQNYQTDESGPFTAVDVLASVGRSLWSLHEPQQQLDMFRLVAFRELPARIGSYNFHVFVRNDLLPTYNAIRY